MPIVNIKPTAIGLGKITNSTNILDINDEWTVTGLYPVGSIHITTDATNPATYFGGTWERFGNGKVLVCVDESYIGFQTAQITGGESYHTLIEAEMPSHKHQHSKNESAIKSSGSIDRPYVYGSTSPHINSEYSYSGNTVAHNNLQPYITCYMWVRTG